MRPTVSSDSVTILRYQPWANSKDRDAQLFRIASSLPRMRLRDLALGPGPAGGSPAGFRGSSGSAGVRPSRQRRTRSPVLPRIIIARHTPPQNATKLGRSRLRASRSQLSAVHRVAAQGRAPPRREPSSGTLPRPDAAKAHSMVRAAMQPSRSTCAPAPVRSTMVDGTGLFTRPASRISERRSPSCAATSAAERAPVRPERLALVPVSGHLACRTSALTSGERGKRTATVPLPAVTNDETLGVAGSTSVKGPGQNRRARTANAGGLSATIPSSLRKESSSNRMGLSSGRPLSRNNSLRADPFRASASRP